ncbi:hypothetical protein BGX38DRAFT_1219032 [Terfezia claveryi]|nr:hypothetical protein BGX38DRAFT_1246848 [Terfezia claveryi]KAF8434669.1 hypothetical protein BGX38DRAFT_1219032 [Terfezia claveryi]
MRPFLGLALAFVVSFIQVAEGIQCDSDCAACWKIGVPGVDIKFGSSERDGEFGIWCPKGYHDIHCAKFERCVCDNRKGDCEGFGPCLCAFKQDPLGITYCPSKDECFL